MKLKALLWKLYPVSFKDKVFFAEHLRVMTRSGIPLADAVKTLAEQTTNKRFKKILAEIKTNLEAGETLSQNLAKYPDIFSKTFVSMISAGEISGTLEANLEELANQMRKEHQLRSRLRSALSYPIVIIIATVGIILLLMLYILPKLLDIFAEFEADLPLPTIILIAIVNFLKNHGLLALFILLLIIFGLIMFYRTNAGKKLFHKIFLIMPILGPITQKVNLARFSRTFSALLKTDIPVVQSLEITAETLSNAHYKRAMLEAKEEIKKGINIAEVISKYPKLFPPLVIQMISVGEKSGTVDELLRELANFYEEEVDNTTKSLSSIIEPLLILFLGVVIGGIAIAVIMPMYTLTQQI